MADIGQTKFNIDADVRRAKRAYAQLGSFLNTRELAEAIGLQQVRWIDKNFRDEGTVNPWAKLSPSTIDNRPDGGVDAKILQDTGRLKASFATYKATNTEVRIGPGSNVKYAATHQFGDPKRNIEARPMLPPKDVAEKNAARLMNAMIQRETTRAGF